MGGLNVYIFTQMCFWNLSHYKILFFFPFIINQTLSLEVLVEFNLLGILLLIFLGVLITVGCLHLSHLGYWLPNHLFLRLSLVEAFPLNLLSRGCQDASILLRNCMSTEDGVENLRIQATGSSHGGAGIQRLVVVSGTQFLMISSLLTNLY